MFPTFDRHVKRRGQKRLGAVSSGQYRHLWQPDLLPSHPQRRDVLSNQKSPHVLSKRLCQRFSPFYSFVFVFRIPGSSFPQFHHTQQTDCP
ncbi:unnamed protein product [Haemonchus placei]|uniref:Uncharacterized protein n=1 Tax=Haemonchus placei TaxID=6290 RepID=A0A3P7V918_HAEPC|nr:unnamed protein product [Haemonchus placei]